MAHAMNTHKYEAQLQTDYTFVKTGERSFLWGAIKYTTGYTTKTTYDTGLCKYCFKPLINHHPLKADKHGR